VNSVAREKLSLRLQLFFVVMACAVIVTVFAGLQRMVA
jgi:hypothetical protein